MHHAFDQVMQVVGSNLTERQDLLPREPSSVKSMACLQHRNHLIAFFLEFNEQSKHGKEDFELAARSFSLR